MTEEEKEYIKKVNIDKAKNKTIAPIILIGLSLFTYVIPLFIYGEFDFGVIFELASLVFLILARSYMSKYDEIRSKRYIICSMISIGWILIYDIMIFISIFQDAVELSSIGYIWFIEIAWLAIYLIMLFKINKNISKADNPERYKESTDWFYEKYEDTENKVK